MGISSLYKHKSVGPLTRLTHNGVLHCDTGPAVFNADLSYQEFWINGRRHREGGQPALIDTRNHREEYWENDKRHRLNGPAIIAPGGERYWIEGKQLTSASQRRFDELLPNVTKENVTELLAAMETRKDQKRAVEALVSVGYNKKHAKQIAERAAIAKIFTR